MSDKEKGYYEKIILNNSCILIDNLDFLSTAEIISKSKMNSSGLIDPELCAKNIIKMIIKCDSSYNGKFLDLRTNKEINW